MRINGAKVKELRGNRPRTELATAADLGERRISDIEAGSTANVNLNIAKAIAKWLGVKLEVIAL